MISLVDSCLDWSVPSLVTLVPGHRMMTGFIFNFAHCLVETVFAMHLIEVSLKSLMIATILMGRMLRAYSLSRVICTPPAEMSRVLLMIHLESH